MSDEPDTPDAAAATADTAPMPDSAEMDIRERLTVLEEDLDALRQATQGLALVALCIAGCLTVLLILRTRGGAS